MRSPPTAPKRSPSKHTQHQLLAALKDPRVYILAAGWGTVPLCGTILNYWTPTIIRQAGVADVLNVGLLSALPYIIGALGMFIGRAQFRRDAGAALALLRAARRSAGWAASCCPAVGQHGGGSSSVSA